MQGCLTWGEEPELAEAWDRPRTLCATAGVSWCHWSPAGKGSPELLALLGCLQHMGH